MYSNNCWICPACCSSKYCQYNNNLYQCTHLYNNSCCNPCNNDIDYQTATSFNGFGQSYTKIPIMPLQTTRTQILSDVARRPMKSKKKVPSKTTKRTSYIPDTVDDDNYRDGEQVNAISGRDEEMSRDVERKNGMNSNCCSCNLCRCGSPNCSRNIEQQNRKFITKNGLPITNDSCCPCPRGSSGSRRATNSTSVTDLAKFNIITLDNCCVIPKVGSPQSSYNSQDSYNCCPDGCIYDIQEARNADSNMTGTNPKAEYQMTPTKYQIKCNFKAVQQQQQPPSPPKTFSSTQSRGTSARTAREQLDVIAEESEVAVQNDSSIGGGSGGGCGYHNNRTAASNGKTDDRPKTQKCMENFCCGFLNIVCENILESVQKSMDGMLQEYCSKTMDKIEAMCGKFEDTEKRTNQNLSDILEKMSEQDDNHLQQFQILMQCLMKNRNVNESSQSGKESPRTSQGSPQSFRRGSQSPQRSPQTPRGSLQSSQRTPQPSRGSPQLSQYLIEKGCQCTAEDSTKENKGDICCFVINAENCIAAASSAETASTKRKVANTNEPQEEATNEQPDSNSLNDEADGDSINDDAVGNNLSQCQCSDPNLSNCNNENCRAECRQSILASENNDLNQDTINSPNSDDSDVKGQNRPSLKYPNFIVTRDNASTALQPNISKGCSSQCRCHLPDEETSGYATAADENTDEADSSSPMTGHKEIKPNRPPKKPSAQVGKNQSNLDASENVSLKSKTSPRNSTKLSRL